MADIAQLYHAIAPTLQDATEPKPDAIPGRALTAFLEEHRGFFPTDKEAAAFFGVSPATISRAQSGKVGASLAVSLALFDQMTDEQKRAALTGLDLSAYTETPSQVVVPIAVARKRSAAAPQLPALAMILDVVKAIMSEGSDLQKQRFARVCGDFLETVRGSWK
jgi:hypothetical protein